MGGSPANSVDSYISYRQSYSHHASKSNPFASSNGFAASNSALPEEQRGLMADTDNGDMVIEMDLLPPRWLDIQDEVNDILAKIATQTSTLEKLHQKHVLPGFEDEDVKKKEEREIERLTQDITRSFQLCQKAIVRIDGMVNESKNTGGISNAEEKMAKNLKINLATRVGDASALFRKKQSAYLKSMSFFSSLSS